jgi:hypothetical protein
VEPLAEPETSPKPFSKHRRKIQPDQGQLPGACHRLGGQALAAALHADEQQSLGRRQSVARGFVVESPRAILDPALDLIQTPNLPEVLLQIEVLQHFALADGLLLLLDDQPYVVQLEPPALAQRLGEDPAGLVLGQPPGGAHHAVDEILRKDDLLPGADLPELIIQLFAGRQRQLQQGDVLLQLFRHYQ